MLPPSAFGTGQWVCQRNEKWLLLMCCYSRIVSLRVSFLYDLVWLGLLASVQCPLFFCFPLGLSYKSQCEHEMNQN